MICSKTKLGSELDKINQLLIENGYPTDILLSCINQKLANLAAEKTVWSREVPSIPEITLEFVMFHQSLRIK